VTAMSRTVRARVIVLSQETSRCLDLAGRDIVERHDFGFPVEVVAPTEADTPHGDFPLAEHEHAEAAKFVFRAVSHALAALEREERRPLVLVGAERDLAYFDEVSDRLTPIVGRVHGNHQRDTPNEIAHLVHAALEEYEGQRQRDACDEVREAIGSHAVSGIDDTWHAARAGRGHRLVVEDEYRFPARVVEDALQVASTEAGAVDAVDATLEEVVLHDGDVVVVPAGSLADLGRIALFTRY
jgi:release factor family 3